MGQRLRPHRLRTRASQSWSATRYERLARAQRPSGCAILPIRLLAVADSNSSEERLSNDGECGTTTASDCKPGRMDQLRERMFGVSSTREQNSAANLTCAWGIPLECGC